MDYIGTWEVPAPTIYPFSAFEYHISLVGGLLGAYSLTGRIELLNFAKQASDSIFLPSFNRSPSVFPLGKVRVSQNSWLRLPNYLLGSFLYFLGTFSDPNKFHACNSLAVIGTFGLEFDFLSRETRAKRYQKIACDSIALISSKLSENPAIPLF